MTYDDDNADFWHQYDQESERLETDMDMTKFSQSESKYLKAADFVGKRLKVVISDVKAVELEAEDGRPAQTKPALFFEGKEKGLLLNPTNTKGLCEAYGTDSDGWVGKEIGLSVKEYDNFPPGWVVAPLEVEFEEDVPF